MRPFSNALSLTLNQFNKWKTASIDKRNEPRFREIQERRACRQMERFTGFQNFLLTVSDIDIDLNYRATGDVDNVCIRWNPNHSATDVETLYLAHE